MKNLMSINLILIAGLLAAGCGGSVQSRNVNQEGDNTTDTETRTLSSREDDASLIDQTLLCLAVKDSASVINARSSVFLKLDNTIDPSTTKLRIDKLDLAKVGAALEDHDQRHIKFFVSRIEETGSTPPEELTFRYENTKNENISGYDTAITYEKLLELANNADLEGENAEEILAQTNIILLDTAMLYDVLIIQVYEGTKKLWNHTTLLPYIPANPVTYANNRTGTGKRPGVLVEMHPYFNLVDVITDNNYYVQEAKLRKNCF